MTFFYLHKIKTASYGTVVLWAVLLLLGAGVYSAQATDDKKVRDKSEIRNVLTAYHKALTTGDMKLVASYVVADERFVMIEGKHTNWGWADYRDNHLTPELEGLSKVDFRLDFKALYISGHISGDMAYSSFIYYISPKDDPSLNYGTGRATVVLVRENNRWLIQHFHTS